MAEPIKNDIGVEKDKISIENHETGENITLYIIGTISLSLMLGTSNFMKNKKFN